MITLNDQKRLSKMRAQAEQWEAVNSEAKDWDTPFLLRLIDTLRKEEKK